MEDWSFVWSKDFGLELIYFQWAVTAFTRESKFPEEKVVARLMQKSSHLLASYVAIFSVTRESGEATLKTAA